jgi:hypothetical protein
MGRWKFWSSVVVIAFCAWGCGMAETRVIQPKPPDGTKEVKPSGETRILDAEVKTFLRDEFTIVSARYFQPASAIPWISISKSVQNQMAEKSVKRTMFEWYEPGLDFVEVYPQEKNRGAFALAIPKESRLDSVRLIGFYVLSAPSAAK